MIVSSQKLNIFMHKWMTYCVGRLSGATQTDGCFQMSVGRLSGTTQTDGCFQVRQTCWIQLINCL